MTCNIYIYNAQSMDLLYALHVLIFLFICSIPLWNIKYLKVGVYMPNITSDQVNHANTFTLVLITVIGLNRLRNTKCIL